MQTEPDTSDGTGFYFTRRPADWEVGLGWREERHSIAPFFPWTPRPLPHVPARATADDLPAPPRIEVLSTRTEGDDLVVDLHVTGPGAASRVLMLEAVDGDAEPTAWALRWHGADDALQMPAQLPGKRRPLAFQVPAPADATFTVRLPTAVAANHRLVVVDQHDGLPAALVAERTDVARPAHLRPWPAFRLIRPDLTQMRQTLSLYPSAIDPPSLEPSEPPTPAEPIPSDAESMAPSKAETPAEATP